MLNKKADFELAFLFLQRMVIEDEKGFDIQTPKGNMHAAARVRWPRG